MTRHLGERLPDFVLGALADADYQELDAHVGQCRECAAEVQAATEALAALALELRPEPPSPAVRERLLASIAAAGRFEPFVGRVAELLDLVVEKAREIVAGIDEARSWEPFPIPGVSVVHLPFGPRVRAIDAGLVRVEAGTKFPWHKHLGDERVLVLQGAFRDVDGTVVRAGDEDFKPGGSAHSFEALAGPHLVYLVVLDGGVEFPPPPQV